MIAQEGSHGNPEIHIVASFPSSMAQFTSCIFSGSGLDIPRPHSNHASQFSSIAIQQYIQPIDNPCLKLDQSGMGEV